ncbi:MAG: hypothetical protein SPL13_03010 [Clostridia bacterium]|nr:hypothetical protein [Clostridia bacterium]
MTWELLITLGVLAIAGIGLGVFAAVKSAKNANAAEKPVEQTAPLNEQPETTASESEAQTESAEASATTVEAAETAEEQIKDAVPAKETEEKVIVVGEEPTEEEVVEETEEVVEELEPEPVSIIKLAAIEGSYLKDPCAPFGKTNLDDEVIAKGEINGEPIVIIGGDEALVMDEPIENEELVAAAIEKLEEQPESQSGSFGVRIPFKDKMLGAEEQVQNYYDIINNEFLSYRNVHGRVSVAGVSYRLGRELEGKITYRGKTMKLHLALKVADYDENVYHQKDYSDIKAYVEVPFTVKVKSDRGLKNALTLIAELFNKLGVVKKARYTAIDSIEQLKGIIVNKPINENKEEVKKEEVKQVEVKPVAERKPAPKKEEVKPAVVEIAATETENEVDVESGSFGARIPFKDKILGAEEQVQGYYDEINNEFLSYRKVHGRVSKSCASYRFGRELIAKITYRGKTMKLHLALNVADFDESIYHQKDLGETRAYVEVPFTVKVKSDRGLKNAIALIAALAEQKGIEKKTRFELVNSIAALKEI